MPQYCKEDTIRSYFGDAGILPTQVRIFKNSKANQGYAFAEFENKEICDYILKAWEYAIFEKKVQGIPLSSNLLNQLTNYENNRPLDRQPQRTFPECPSFLLDATSSYSDSLIRRGGRLNPEGLTQLMLKPASVHSKNLSSKESYGSDYNTKVPMPSSFSDPEKSDSPHVTTFEKKNFFFFNYSFKRKRIFFFFC